MAQGDPPAALVERGQRDQEVGHGVLLVAEELGEAVGEGPALGGVHALIVSRPFSRLSRRARRAAGGLGARCRRSEPRDLARIARGRARQPGAMPGARLGRRGSPWRNTVKRRVLNALSGSHGSCISRPREPPRSPSASASWARQPRLSPRGRFAEHRRRGTPAAEAGPAAPPSSLPRGPLPAEAGHRRQHGPHDIGDPSARSRRGCGDQRAPSAATSRAPAAPPRAR